MNTINLESFILKNQPTTNPKVDLHLRIDYHYNHLKRVHTQGLYHLEKSWKPLNLKKGIPALESRDI